MISLIILTCVGLLLLFLGLGKNKAYFAPVAILGLLITIYFQLTGIGQHSPLLSGMLSFDAFSTGFGVVLLVITLLIFLIGIEYYEDVDRNVAENYSLMLFSLVGAILLTSFTNLVILFLGIEILSIPLYILAGGKKKATAPMKLHLNILFWVPLLQLSCCLESPCCMGPRPLLISTP
ncbi:MAG: hypothetical protein AB9842_04740 [Bacteroidales bacterium]